MILLNFRCFSSLQTVLLSYLNYTVPVRQFDSYDSQLFHSYHFILIALRAELMKDSLLFVTIRPSFLWDHNTNPE